LIVYQFTNIIFISNINNEFLSVLQLRKNQDMLILTKDTDLVAHGWLNGFANRVVLARRSWDNMYFSNENKDTETVLEMAKTLKCDYQEVKKGFLEHVVYCFEKQFFVDYWSQAKVEVSEEKMDLSEEPFPLLWTMGFIEEGGI